MTSSLSVLLGTCPAQGHLEPLLPLAQGLVEAGHEVRWLTGRRFAGAVTATGAHGLPLPDSVDFDDTLLDEQFPGRSRLHGLALARHDLAMFVDAIPAQHEAIRDAMHQRGVDVLIPDQKFLGALPLLSPPRQARPAVLVAGIMPLTISGGDIPLGGALPLGGPLGRWRNRLIRAGFTAAFGAWCRRAPRSTSDMREVS